MALFLFHCSKAVEFHKVSDAYSGQPGAVPFGISIVSFIICVVFQLGVCALTISLAVAILFICAIAEFIRNEDDDD